MKAKLLFMVLLMGMSYCIFAQEKVVLTGKINDSKDKEDVIGACVKISQKGIQKGIAASDFEGNYCVALSPDMYDIEVSYVGLKTILIKNVNIYKDTTLNFEMKIDEKLNFGLACFRFDYKIPLMMMDNTSSGATYTSEQIMRSPR